MPPKDLKNRTAHSVKWNLVDKLASQVLYALTGIVLARELSPDDFGLVGAALVFQAFASLLVDSGFSYALLQRRQPSRLDYSTVLWFNIGCAVVLYLVLFACAPLIAGCFQHDMRLVPVSRVLFLAIILNAATIVQTNRLMKAMEVRGVALSNAIGLSCGGAVGIGLAVGGFGVWAIVWQTLTGAAVRGIVLWTSTRWRPLPRFYWPSLRSYFGLGSRMMLTSFLRTVFLNIYSFLIGNRVGLASLGYYTQADKWSKMGTSSLSQVLTSSFVPTLSAVQNQPERYRAMCSKMTRFTAYLLFPAMLWLAAAASPLFHALFGTKWDPAVILFQLLLVRGIFVVLTSLSTNFLLALGYGSSIVKLEVLTDSVALGALVATFPVMGWSTPEHPVLGITILLCGQLLASFVAWVATIWTCFRRVGLGVLRYFLDLAPYMSLTLVIVPLMLLGGSCAGANAWAVLLVEAAIALTAYLGVNRLLGSQIQRDVLEYIRKGMK